MIRRARSGDAAALQGLHAAAFETGWTEKAFTDLLAEPSVLGFIDTAETGFILVRVAAEEAEILAFGVAPEARRAGLGRALLRRARLEAPRRGAGVMLLEVAVDNAAALALYLSEGFETVGRRRQYYARAGGRSVDAALLRLLLPGPA